MRSAFAVLVLAVGAGACTIEGDPFVPSIDAAGPPTGMIVTDVASVSVPEMQSRELRVSLDTSPPVPVTVAIEVGDSAVASVSPTSVYFDFNNFSAPRAITVTGRMDNDALSEDTVVTLSGDGYAARSVAVMVVDDDVLAIQIPNGPTSNVFEGATASVHVTLSAQPPVDVVVNAASNNVGKMTVVPASMMFTPANWDSEQIITVTGVEDPDVANDTATLTLTAAGLSTRTVAYTVLDND